MVPGEHRHCRVTGGKTVSDRRACCGANANHDTYFVCHNPALLLYGAWSHYQKMKTISPDPYPSSAHYLFCYMYIHIMRERAPFVLQDASPLRIFSRHI
jgi:hypothetical protein